MTIEYKKIPYFVKELDVKTRTVVGIFAVHGNIDAGRDMSELGSFTKWLTNNSRDRVRFLWQHNSFDPPIASIKDIHEVARQDLPEKVLEWAPMATGGVQVTRKYYEGVPLSDWVFKAITEGDVTEMSYAYQVHGYEIRMDEATQREIRVLKEVQLFDVSDVNWGMNPATAGVKHLGMEGDLKRFQVLLTGLKEGRVLSSANREKVASAVGAMESAITALSELLNISEPDKSLLETGETLNERAARVEAALGELMEWAGSRKTIREAEGRALSGALRERFSKMAVEIEHLLEETQPPADVKAAEQEFLRFLQNQSKFAVMPR